MVKNKKKTILPTALTLFGLMVIFASACSKTDFTSDHNISDLVSELDVVAQKRYKIRLVFGKAVASA